MAPRAGGQLTDGRIGHFEYRDNLVLVQLAQDGADAEAGGEAVRGAVWRLPPTRI